MTHMMVDGIWCTALQPQVVTIIVKISRIRCLHVKQSHELSVKWPSQIDLPYIRPYILNSICRDGKNLVNNLCIYRQKVKARDKNFLSAISEWQVDCIVNHRWWLTLTMILSETCTTTGNDPSSHTAFKPTTREKYLHKMNIHYHSLYLLGESPSIRIPLKLTLIKLASSLLVCMLLIPNIITLEKSYCRKGAWIRIKEVILLHYLMQVFFFTNF